MCGVPHGTAWDRDVATWVRLFRSDVRVRGSSGGAGRLVPGPAGGRAAGQPHASPASPATPASPVTSPRPVPGRGNHDDAPSSLSWTRRLNNLQAFRRPARLTRIAPYSFTRRPGLPHSRSRQPGFPGAISMIAKTFIPEKGAQPFAIMKRLVRAPPLEVTLASAGSYSPRPGRINDPSRRSPGTRGGNRLWHLGRG